MHSEIFTYIVEAGRNLKINTPGITDFSQIKKEIVQMPDKIFNRSTYPTGLILDIEQKAGQIIIYSNRKLIQNPDGSYTAPET